MRIHGIIAAFAMLGLIGLFSCGSGGEKTQMQAGDSLLKGELVIFHAGSLAVPVKQACDSFMLMHPQVRIRCEAAGSKECARKITDLNKPCDIMFSADYQVIDFLMIPSHASWNLRFATNEMAIVYNEHSAYADQIDSLNWPEILMKKEVRFGRSNPDSDPCGVRAHFTVMLSEIYYGKRGLYKEFLGKDLKYIRPKETDLLALLETGTVDYIFLYRSVAQQHGLKYLILPDHVNLRHAGLKDYYAQVSLETIGKKPGEKITETGAPMVYGLTIPAHAPNKELAIAFLRYFLGDAGKKIMEENGQPFIVPAPSDTYHNIPEALKCFALPDDPQ
jgi:molybdate/tungstate transport system substrate-binding protein